MIHIRVNILIFRDLFVVANPDHGNPNLVRGKSVQAPVLRISNEEHEVYPLLKILQDILRSFEPLAYVPRIVEF